MNSSPRPSRARMAVAAWWVLFLAVALALPAAAQKPKPAPKPHPAPHTVYRLDYVIRQLRGGKVINQRRYELLAREPGESSLHVGNHVPIVTSTGSGSVQYMSVGVSINARVSELHGSPGLNSYIQFSSTGAEAVGSGTKDPVTKGFSADIVASIRPNVPTVLATLDDVTSNDRYQIFVTAIPQKP